MKILSIYKLGFLGIAIVLLTGLTGCVQQAVVSTHHRVAFDNRMLISSNIAYYERYGYPEGYSSRYAKPYYSVHQPRTIVVKKVRVVHDEPHYRHKPRHHDDYRQHKSRSSYVKPHRAIVNIRVRDNRLDKHHHDGMRERKLNHNAQAYDRVPVKRYNKPRPVSYERPAKQRAKPPHYDGRDTDNQARHNR